ncbi:putative permease [Silvibacterium bohemicum]|uniref:Putative permease n=1 Tax=Silvibacterium bohemicum TaxID=1577686 RepID=A0A841JVV4_9BACT|nr:ABC transporter permease [Silvibacterium bohemicum]MBB6145533.1 putative permease [Silvibacterium bohemicum]
MGNLWNDLKHALHMFIKNPGFTLAAVGALALGVGANTAIFSVVNTVLLKPLTYPDPDRIIQFQLTSPQGSGSGASITKFHNWQEQTSVFQDVSAYDFGGPGFNLTGAVPEQIHGIHVSKDYFKLFGAPIMLGRTFTQQEDLPNGGKVVVLSYGLWKRKFGSNPNIVGSTISLGNEPYTIIGVLGPNFDTDPVSDIWLPFQFDPNSVNQGHFFLAAARLKPGVTLAQANAQLKVAADQFRRRYPGGVLDPKDGFAAMPLRDSIVSDVRSSLFVLLGAVGFVLLIACANVANLLLVRATGRKREFAIRAAMGAGRMRIISQLLTESILLSVTGGVLGLILGYVGVRALLTVSPGGIPRIGENGTGVSLDWRVLLFTLGVSLFTGILFGLFPAFSASRPDLNTTLKESSNRSGTGFRSGIARSILVVSEVSLALVLLIGAALLIRTYLALREVKPGFDSHHVLAMDMSLTGDRFMKSAGVAQLVRNGRDRLSTIPGVEADASTCCLPLEGGFGLPFAILGRPTNADGNTGGAGWMSASPGYFSVFRIPILRGRDFTDQDDGTAAGVVIINEAMVKKFWPKGDALGQQIVVGKGVGPQFAEGPRQIIGIVGDIHDGGLNRDPRPQMIVPQAQVTDGMTALNAGIGPVVWAVRTTGDPHQLAAQIQEQLRQASGGFPVARIRTMDEVVVRSTAREDFNMLLLTIFGASALILAAIGIYGLMAYSVQQRTQEMGIRMALGADRGRIRNLVVWHGMRLALIGVAIGVGAAFGLSHLIASLLFGVKAYDPTVFVAVPVILTAVALFAVWMPATRASKLDPMQALRVE